MRTVVTAALLLIAVALVACGDNKPTEVIAEPALQTMEKAREVQATVDQQKAAVDAAVEEQSK